MTPNSLAMAWASLFIMIWGLIVCSGGGELTGGGEGEEEDQDLIELLEEELGSVFEAAVRAFPREERE